MTEKEEFFIQQLLQERDQLYRETSKLKSKLSSFDNYASERDSYQQQLQQKDQTIDQLKQTINQLQRKIWGKSSEKRINSDPAQRILDFEGLDILEEEKQLVVDATSEIEIQKKERVVKRTEKKKPVRKPLPEHLPRVDEHIYPENINLYLYDELTPEITEILEKKPVEFYVRRIFRHKYALKSNTQVESQDQPIVIAPVVMQPIAKSYAGATVLADMMIDKYVNHLPFYRQIKMFKQQGLDMAASTVNGWFGDVADLLRPTYYRLMELVQSSDYIQSDETTIPIVHNEKHKTVKGYLWMLRAVMPGLVFFYYDQGSRAQKVALKLFKNFQGALQSDGYAVYDMYENKKGVTTLNCWAHARRKFTEAIAEDKERAEYALQQIGLLYDVERIADADNLSYEERAALRARLAYPIMVVFEKWLLSEYPKVLPKGRIGKAIRYTYDRFHKLSRYHLDGRYQIDNNLAENQIRPIALGRKNWLFCKNNESAENAAIIYSMMGCCNASGVNFRDWMIYFLENVHKYDTDYSMDLAELLPHSYAMKNNKN